MLEVKNATAGYGRQNVLDGISVGFKKGQLTSIVGVNGSGKSTLLKSMLGILPIRKGEIYVDGCEISSMKRIEIAKRIAYLSQGRATPDMTVMQMVLHGRFPYLSYPRRYTGLDREIAYSAMERVGISELADKPLCTLSCGMRQNAYIAMALAQDTDYILLDEPTTYLDISHQLAVIKILRELAKDGKGIVIVMHDLPMAFEFSDEIAVLSDGKLNMQASPKEACLSSAVQKLFGLTIKYLPEKNKFFYDY